MADKDKQAQEGAVGVIATEADVVYANETPLALQMGMTALDVVRSVSAPPKRK